MPKKEKVYFKIELNEQDTDWLNAARLKAVYKKSENIEAAIAAKKELDRMGETKLYTFEELK